MLLSRGAPLLKATKLLQQNAPKALQSVRNSSHVWNYRCRGPEPPKTMVYLAEAVQGVAWWWVLWHLWTEPGHVFGEFEYPDPRKWTDEELGIPPAE
ncbi:NADH dehydrogenase [ubiquinone] 1 beta subcomplex subunit 2, mitochondrial [Tribolium castaneum]|uniref:NADH dehydrogenase [ubiquinone] 1 beta subcomplex subunit 2, mitochondrial-like Protein n=1 Tax=Tribolium castaneum TaxID=7070 RepID=D6X3U6_TRICA|nr:PREDICTED: NADH dehydrogenase [ubiquinone] 1 beta subcomplex subunit 2, mitochondrial [Tribolium castaneum]EEZ97472.1 NADH dehydrogenase [ubiquinone] 1 beta subcomplex subunit 2, mitochondrial-like Protein [Tribolium castaneum]|eukprot:XP_970769.1 PREDICTED: NADH dehydrogenase [ubiquinone] 1 beta subcomplex subunit 2, mitochondrial [Tribolium castaneum]